MFKHQPPLRFSIPLDQKSQESQESQKFTWKSHKSLFKNENIKHQHTLKHLSKNWNFKIENRNFKIEKSKFRFWFFRLSFWFLDFRFSIFFFEKKHTKQWFPLQKNESWINGFHISELNHFMKFRFLLRDIRGNHKKN